jgi:DNA polymerase I-like protein with 3'-5' exonuclease and polymerase domains
MFVKPNNLQAYLDSVDKIIAHNGIFFDFPVLKKVWGITVKRSQVVDTLVLARLYDPSIEGGHSLEAWGERLGHYKAPYKQIWSWMTGTFLDKDNANLPFDEPVIPLLHHYCARDTLVTAQLYKHLDKEMQNDFSEQSKELEHQVAIIIAEQERNGFKLDEKGASQLLCSLKTKLETIQVEMQSIFPPKVQSNRVHKTTGKALADIVEPFNPGSRKQIAERLIEKGWKPKKHTEKGSVIVDETTLEGINIPEAKAIAEYLMLQKRIAQIESWIEAIEPDGRVHGRVITNGAVTGRMTHHSPNMAQIPNSGAIYGPECRNLWTVEKGNSLVGIDASGLELRMLAHYMNDDEYTHQVVSGDIHTTNQKAAGLETRNQAKTFIYAFLYGAGSAKIGAISGGGAKEGQLLIDRFLRNTPKLKKLREKISGLYSEKGWLPGLDGRKLLVRSEHSSLNTILQGAGAIVMKKALVLFKEELQSQKIWHEFKANVHDEWQVECREEDAERVGQLGKQAISKVVKKLEILDDNKPNPKKRLRCPLDGEYKIGKTWKDTH